MTTFPKSSRLSHPFALTWNIAIFYYTSSICFVVWFLAMTNDLFFKRSRYQYHSFWSLWNISVIAFFGERIVFSFELDMSLFSFKCKSEHRLTHHPSSSKPLQYLHFTNIANLLLQKSSTKTTKRIQ